MNNIPEKMNAVVAYAPGDYRLEQVETPRAGEGEMILKVEACGICAGDVKAYHGAKSFWGGDGNPPYIKAPMIPGHEFVGHVVEMGPNVKGDWKIGDRICPEQIVPCGECMFCKTGRYWMCEKHDLFGFQNNVNGGMAEYVRLTKEAIPYLIPESLAIEKAILTEPYACSWHCVDRAQIGNTDVVVLSGVGTLGLGMVGAIRQRNPKTLVVLDMNDARLEKAKEFGADIIMNPGKTDVVSAIKDLTGGYGCDIYIEATGHPSSVEQGLQCIRKMGRFVEFSVFAEKVSVDWSIISDRKELDLLGVHLSPYCYDTVIDWIESGKLPTNGVVSHKLPLGSWKEGFDAAAAGAEGTFKVVLVPGL
ncbi:alcohol dehydrogenase catalytic domain-containing protein [Muricomes intestini]|jgi:2-desacetyl-2-hydroxyethyl bacteriochlorophyllide A dehydrogenase|uniref:2-desacetyl-2-hydroxyethyl bacteriochlorophyllide A dehydrogenase n=1 Tax=Muricomes intestini TaxID=1796634 RepID=A0A4R3K468_9FIRM|nr:alcohol dehydrogenase catalytic domain-containing protein [Muricomes intestini]TCS77451.1 2-desacetyl-2-hydroxyethyl bacteriochlorophyllide A dehydrogenase [Muricomes intestini]